MPVEAPVLVHLPNGSVAFRAIDDRLYPTYAIASKVNYNYRARMFEKFGHPPHPDEPSQDEIDEVTASIRRASDARLGQ